MTQRCGIVAVVGAPNAGKSTLVNALVGQKVAIVSAKAQTTRTRLMGIAMAGDAQIVLVDTPGIFEGRRRFDRAMVQAAWGGAADADLIALVIDAKAGLGAKVETILSGLATRPEPKLLVLNKVDVADHGKLLRHLTALNERLSFADTMIVSAATGDGIEDLKARLAAACPEGPWHFPADQVSDATDRVMAAEVTREQNFGQLYQELPQACPVVTEQYQGTPRRLGRDPPANPRRARQPARDRARQRRGTAEGNRQQGACRTRSHHGRQGPPLPAREGKGGLGRGPQSLPRSRARLGRMSDPLFQAGRNCWRVERATRASIIVDAADYFTAARAAMLKARHRIMLVGWDFDARIELGDGAEGGPKTVGEFVIWLVDRTPGLEVYLLRWDLGALKMLWQGSTIFTLFKWMRHPRIHTRLDGAHPVGASHHQKIVAIDDCFAFCGGIDVTSNRWDTREHNDDDPRRVQPNGKPHGPWHDATSALEGPVAAALGELCRDRWHRAGGAPLDPVPGVDDCWPDPLPVDFNGIEVAVARTAPDMPDYPAVHEIEQLYIDMIRRARHFIYAESQYFASRRIAEAIALRLDEADGPEIVVINPVVAQGWLEPLAMDTARARLFEAPAAA